MKQISMTTPIYIIEEKKLRKNLALIADVAKKADVEIILARRTRSRLPIRTTRLTRLRTVAVT